MLTSIPSPALRYSVNTWGEAMARIAQDGHLFDVGQIAADVVGYLHRAGERVRVTRDSYPIRGFEGGERKTVFERGCTPPSPRDDSA